MVATLRGVRGCHAQGRTVDEARRRIREALELFVHDARKAPIGDDVKLPAAATRAIRATAHGRLTGCSIPVSARRELNQ